MPSRRTVLGAVGVGLASGVAGCLSGSQRVSGYIQYKSIAGVIERSNRRREESIISVDASYEPSESPPDVSLDDEWADYFPAPRMPVVPESLDADLRNEFDSVRYVVGVTSPEWADEGESVGSFNVATSRENFNRVQVHTEVTASSDGTYLTIHSVDGLWEFGSED
ncbi:hypothetical protein C440_04178 [Haloferax mucosum ATCC BAA-1512]|uniref:Lipoprotein n=1 Tax=Haloferax mucosum ATCC BAA-1512 TaxID=662479 RepID=M0IM61_9EURY|nr:hypothetical protein [Haloferax mucosum]ELZ96943.1 hypothetical protein C440_04178 [Haloferax mucosum ATCC BAA-1512]